MKKHLNTLPLAAAMFMCGNTIVHADNHLDNWYFSPMLSYIKADSDRQADDGFGVHLGFGKPLSDSWNIELSAVIDNMDFEAGSGEYTQRGLLVDGLYFYNRGKGMQTYGVIGAGVMSTDIGATDSTNAMVNIGVGMMKEITDSGMIFRADIRYRMDMDDESVTAEDEFNDVLLNIGLSIPFGGEEKSKTAKIVALINTQDSDNDGVIDSIDSCPATASGVVVNDKGCEIIRKEEMPNEAKIIDSDHDGVVDSKDKCPSTASDVSVDIYGCELQQSFVLKGVNFVTSSDELTENSKDELNEVAATLKKNPALSVEVAGYTDDRGSAAFNQRLSQKRAEMVKAYLESAGVDAQQMTAKGYGEESPIADNQSTTGRTQNRRVELHLLK